LRNEEEEEDLETKKREKKRKKEQETDNYHISTQMSQNSKKQDSKYDNTKNLVFIFKFQTRKMQNKRKTEFARIYLLACELQRSLLSPEEEDAANQSSACLPSTTTTQLNLHELCAGKLCPFLAFCDALCVLPQHFLSLFCEAFSVACPQNRCWADTRCCPVTSVGRFLFKKEPPVPVFIL
jgi:hypothetical protein